MIPFFGFRLNAQLIMPGGSICWSNMPLSSNDFGDYHQGNYILRSAYINDEFWCLVQHPTKLSSFLLEVRERKGSIKSIKTKEVISEKKVKFGKASWEEYYPDYNEYSFPRQQSSHYFKNNAISVVDQYLGYNITQDSKSRITSVSFNFEGKIYNIEEYTMMYSYDSGGNVSKVRIKELKTGLIYMSIEYSYLQNGCVSTIKIVDKNSKQIGWATYRYKGNRLNSIEVDDNSYLDEHYHCIVSYGYDNKGGINEVIFNSSKKSKYNNFNLNRHYTMSNSYDDNGHIIKMSYHDCVEGKSGLRTYKYRDDGNWIEAKDSIGNEMINIQRNLY